MLKSSFVSIYWVIHLILTQTESWSDTETTDRGVGGGSGVVGEAELHREWTGRERECRQVEQVWARWVVRRENRERNRFWLFPLVLDLIDHSVLQKRRRSRTETTEQQLSFKETRFKKKKKKNLRAPNRWVRWHYVFSFYSVTEMRTWNLCWASQNINLV